MTTPPAEPSLAMIRANWAIIAAAIVALGGYWELHSTVRTTSGQVAKLIVQEEKRTTADITLAVTMARLETEVALLRQDLRRPRQERTELDAQGIAPARIDPARLAEPMTSR